VEEEDDVELTEFSDVIESWVVQNLLSGLDTINYRCKKQDVRFSKKNDLEEEKQFKK
jgi:hypothetical protein